MCVHHQELLTGWVSANFNLLFLRLYTKICPLPSGMLTGLTDAQLVSKCVWKDSPFLAQQ